MPTQTKPTTTIDTLVEGVADLVEAIADLQDQLRDVQSDADRFYASQRHPQMMRAMNSFNKFGGSLDYAKNSGRLLQQIIEETSMGRRD